MALGFFDSSNDPSAPDSYDAMSRKRKLLDALLLRPTDTSPVQHWTQGLARVLDSAGNSYQDAKLSEKEKDANLASSDYMKRLTEALSGGGSPSAMSAPAGASSPPTASADGSPNYRDAIASIESRGSGDYAALGPVTGKGDRAFGRYQVMGANIPEWTQAALGRSMTPQEFLASPEAQDKVFDHRFGGYVQKYGNPQDAASAWFTGRPLAQGGNARDQLGTSGLAYADKFTRALGQSPAQGAINGALRADMPAPGAQDSGGAPMPAGVNMPPLQAPGSAPIPSASGFNAPIGIPQNVDPANAAAELAAADPVAPSGRDRIAAAVTGNPPSVPLPPARPNMPGETLPAGSPEAQAFTRLEGQPDPNAPAPGATPAQFAIPGASGADRGKALIAAALADPRLSPQQKQMALQMYAMSQKDQGVTHVDLGNSIGIMDHRGNIVRTLPKQKDAQFGVIGKDVMGREQYGFIDPSKQQITPSPQMNGADGGGMVTVQGPNGPVQVPAAVAKDVQAALGKRMGSDLAGPDADAESKLRSEVQGLPAYKNLAQAKPIYESMRKTAGTNSKASDLNLVYGLGKIFDPGSVVREGEMIMVKNTASLPDWLVGAANALNGGQALLPETRKAILAEAHNRVTSYQDQFINDADHYKGIAGRQKMNIENVINPNLLKPFEPWQGDAPVRVFSLEDARKLPKGARFIDPNGVERINP